MKKKILPHIIAIIAFAALAAIYFAPQYEGREVRKGDDIQASGMAGGMAEHKAEYGEHPQWAANMFSGMPAYLIDMDYSGRYVKEVSSTFYFLGRPAAYYFILMAGFYLMLLMMGVSPLLAIPGSIAYGLSSYFVIIYGAGHITKLMALAYIAPMIGAIYYAYKKDIWLGAALAGIFASIEISTSHPQITYYFLFVIVGLVAMMGYNFYKEGRMASFWKRSAVLTLAALLAVGSNIIQLWYVAEYAKDSTRSRSELTASDDNSHNHTSGLDKDYATQWSYGIMETFNLFIPNLMGGASSGGFSEDGEVAKALGANSRYATMLPGYWGDQPGTSGPVYVGAVVVFLFILGIMLIGGAMRWWLIGVTILSIVLAWGHNFMWLTDLMLDYFPGYNKFRTVSMILVIAQWSMPLMGMLALKRIWDEKVEKTELEKTLKYATAIAGGIALFFIILGSGMFDFSGGSDAQFPDEIVSAMVLERADMLRADAIRSLIFVVLTAALILFWYRGKVRRDIFVLALSTLVLYDMVPVDRRYLSYEDFVPTQRAKAITPTEADKAIMGDSDPNFRVANFTVSPFQDATTSYFHKSVGGYHAAKMRRYNDIISGYLSKMKMDTYNMLNTKYFIVPSEEGGSSVQFNPDAYGNAWFVDDVIVVENPDEEFTALEDISTRYTAVVDRRFVEQLASLVEITEADSLDEISLIDYRINRLTYKSSSSKPRLAIFSEIYYDKGWTLTIDGKEADYLRADYILRGAVIPAGEHTLEFSFKAPNFATVKGVTIFCSLALLLAAVAAIVVSIKKRRDVQS